MKYYLTYGKPNQYFKDGYMNIWLGKNPGICNSDSGYPELTPDVIIKSMFDILEKYPKMKIRIEK